MNSYSIGQKVVISQFRGIRSGMVLRDGEVSKIGRKWITVKTGQWSEERFGFDGRAEDQAGWSARLWPDVETYEADARRRAAWDQLHALIRQCNHAPDHITTEQIEAMIAMVQPAEKAEMSSTAVGDNRT